MFSSLVVAQVPSDVSISDGSPRTPLRQFGRGSASAFVSSDFDRSTNSLAGMAEGEDLPASEFSAQFAAASAADGDAEREAEPGDNGPAAGASAASGGGSGGAGPSADGERGSGSSIGGGLAGGRREPVIRRVKAAQRESPESPRSSGSRSSAASAAEDKEPEQAGSPGKPSDSGQAPRRISQPSCLLSGPVRAACVQRSRMTVSRRVAGGWTAGSVAALPRPA